MVGKSEFWGFGFDRVKEVTRDTRRAFTRAQKNQILAQQNNKCAKCKKPLDMRAVQFDHKKAWANGGETLVKNGRALCSNCHSKVTHKATLKKVEKKKKPSRSSDLLGIWGTKPKKKKSSKEKKEWEATGDW